MQYTHEVTLVFGGWIGYKYLKVLVNPVRNSNRALTPVGIILKCYSPGEEQDIISDGVNGDGE